MNFAAFALANLLGGYARGRRERTEFEEEKRNRDRTLRLSEERLNEERKRREWEQEQAAYKREQDEYSRDRDEYWKWIETARTAASNLNPQGVAAAVAKANSIAEKRGFAKVDPDMFSPGAKTVAEHLGKVAEIGLPWSAVAPGVHWALGTQAPPPPPPAAPAPGPAIPPPAAATPVTPSLGVAAALRPAESAVPGGALRWPPRGAASLPPPGVSAAPAPGPAPGPSTDSLGEEYDKTRRRLRVKSVLGDLADIARAGATGEELSNFLAVATGERDPWEAIKGSGLSLRQDEIRSKTEKNRADAALAEMKARYIPQEMLQREKELELEAKKAERDWWLDQQNLALRIKAEAARRALASQQLEIARRLADLRAEEFDHRRWRDRESLILRSFETAALSASWDTPLNQDIARDAWDKAKNLSLPGAGALPGGGAPPAKAAPPAPGAPTAQRKTGSSLSPEDRQLNQWRKHGLVLLNGKKVSGAQVDEFVRAMMLKGKSNAQIVEMIRRLGAR